MLYNLIDLTVIVREIRFAIAKKEGGDDMRSTTIILLLVFYIFYFNHHLEAGGITERVARKARELRDKTRQEAEEAARKAILAGTLQFHRSGVQPVTRKDLEAALTSADGAISK